MKNKIMEIVADIMVIFLLLVAGFVLYGILKLIFSL